ncbi:MAG: diacylglycerol kinase family lipid kinase [Verrucomicrobiota bacterium]
MRACVIFNPAAKGQKAERFRRCLEEIAKEATLKQTTAPRDARRLATQAVADGFDTIIAAGGDGTLNEVLNGIGDAPEGFQHTRLGVLPLGTVNVFARELGLPSQPDKAWQILRQGRERRIDLPYFINGEPEAREKIYFAQLAGAGLDSRAIELVDWSVKKRIGPLAYVVAGLKAISGPQARINVSDGIRTVTGELVLVGNGRKYGGDFRVFPAAKLDSGLLEVCIFPKVNWGVLARCGARLLLTHQLPPTGVVRLRGTSFSLIAEATTWFEVDGELAGHLPAQLRILPAGLRVLSP